MAEKTVRIGGASGFWGDSMMAAPQLVHDTDIDYLVFDYLAEITMSIMARMRAKDPQSGYAVDFVTVIMKRLMRDIAAKGIRVVSNAGGTNPIACAEALEEIAAAEGLDLKIAVALGDDLLDQADRLRELGTREMFSTAAFPDKVMSVNAYYGALPIKQALDLGADIVVTGRCVDSAVTLGPLMHEFGWQADDYDLLAAGSLTGHLLECGAQATGGLFTDWDQVPDWDNIGYPVADCRADGSFIITKPPKTGGLVTPAVLAEQMLYEIGDPQAYILPDVVCDFSDVRMRQEDTDRVHVSGAKGYPPTDRYKVCATYQDGYRAIAALTIGGIDAAAKARRTGKAILARTRRMLGMQNFGDYTATNIEVIGAEDMYGPHSRIESGREAVLRLSVTHDNPRALGLFAREATSPGTSMSPGTTGFFGGRPKVSPVVRLFSFLLPKAEAPARVILGGEKSDVEVPTNGGFDPAMIRRPTPPAAPEELPGERFTVPLVALAWGRSGDKGDSANIGIIARKPAYLPVIRSQLTPAAVADYIGHRLAADSEVTCYDLPGISGINFVLTKALGGGGMATLRNDSLGKAYAQMVLDFPIDLPRALDPSLAEFAA